MNEMAEVYALCRLYGPMLRMPPGSGINGGKFMAAVAGCESSFGRNCTPRYEPAYDVGGEYAENSPQRELLEGFGTAAAYSYGPWQMMPCNAKGFSPKELNDDWEKCALAFVSWFNRYIIGFRHAMTMDEMFQTYNSGHYTAKPSPGVALYVEDGFRFYSLVDLTATEVTA